MILVLLSLPYPSITLTGLIDLLMSVNIELFVRHSVDGGSGVIGMCHWMLEAVHPLISGALLHWTAQMSAEVPYRQWL